MTGTRSLLWNIVLSGTVLVLLAAAFSRLPGLGMRFVAASLAGFAAAAVVLSFLACRHLDAQRFGAANGVTLLRLALTALLSALLLAPVETSMLWLCIGIATTALLLDGVDGRLARRFGASSRFGARFDMEVDAVLVFVLALLVWHFERAGIWVLAAGLLRYVFVAAALVLPWMRVPLPPSLRRKTICIFQSTALLVCIGPIVPGEVAPWIAATGVALLVWSFAIDVIWLYEHHRSGVRA
ncbi:MAG: CDP-alcohol phosphatidyltransferase family protein [Gammaproteobacteria bacterium]